MKRRVNSRIISYELFEQNRVASTFDLSYKSMVADAAVKMLVKWLPLPMVYRQDPYTWKCAMNNVSYEEYIRRFIEAKPGATPMTIERYNGTALTFPDEGKEIGKFFSAIDRSIPIAWMGYGNIGSLPITEIRDAFNVDLETAEFMKILSR